MTAKEIARLVRKLSRRRHRLMKDLTSRNAWEFTSLYRVELAKTRANIATVDEEIKALLARMPK